jgi:transcriptional regulator with XRE-family HTH domain
MSRRHPNRLTQAEVADLLGFGRNKIAALTRNGHLPSLTDPDTGRPDA